MMTIRLSPAAVDAILRDACHAALTGAAPVFQSQALTRLRLQQLASAHENRRSVAPRRPPGELITVEVLRDSDVAVITPTRAGVCHAARLFYDSQPKELTAYTWKASGGQSGLCWLTQEQACGWIGDGPLPWAAACGHIWISAASRKAYVFYIESLYERASASIQPE